MSNLTTLSTKRVKEILALNRQGTKAETLLGDEANDTVEEPTYRSEEDSITRFDNAKSKRKRNKRRGKDVNREEGSKNNEVKHEEATPANEPTTTEEMKSEPREVNGERNGSNNRNRNNRNRNRNNRNRGERNNREEREEKHMDSGNNEKSV